METHGYESQVWSELLIGRPDGGGRGLAVAAAVSVSQASVQLQRRKIRENQEPTSARILQVSGADGRSDSA